MGRWLPALLVIAGSLSLSAPAAAQCSITANTEQNIYIQDFKGVYHFFDILITP